MERISITVVWEAHVRVFLFLRRTRPTFRDLLCRLGPLDLRQSDGAPFTRLDCLLETLTELRFSAKEWTPKTVLAHRAVFLGQLRTLGDNLIKNGVSPELLLPVLEKIKEE